MDFYKYRCWQGKAGDNTRSCLMKSAVYLASSISFNDPFDFSPVIETRADYQETKSSVMKSLQRMHSLSKKAAKRAALQHLKDNPRLNSEAARYRSAIEAMNLLRRTVEICCLTTKPDNPAMWAHYGENHQGICIHYELSEFFPVGLPPGTSNNLPVILRSVKYADNRPVVNIFKPNYAEIMFESLLTKSIDWSYESEYRILAQDYIGLSYYKPESLKRIIVGYKMPQNTIEEVRAFTCTTQIVHS